MKQLPHGKLAGIIYGLVILFVILSIFIDTSGIHDDTIFLYLLFSLCIVMYVFLAYSYKKGSIFEFYSKGGIAYKPSWSFYFQFFIYLAFITLAFTVSLYGILMKYFG